MNITSANRMSDIMPAGQAKQSGQDSHEKNIKNRIVSLQGKMRDLTYDTEMSSDEKTDKKKKLQEQIQNLNSELKQYQIQKRREDTEKRRKESEKSDGSVKQASSDNVVNETGAVSTADTSDNASDVHSAAGADDKNVNDSRREADNPETGLSGAEAEMMVSISNTGKQFANMEKIRTNLTGLMRTAETDEEKQKIQKKIDNVSNIIESKARKTADKITEIRKEEQAKKAKIRKLQKEQEERKSKMKAAVPKAGEAASKEKDGKVLITRKKA